MVSDTKLCHYCAEEIKEAAIVCKHCGRELPEFEELKPVIPIPPKQSKDDSIDDFKPFNFERTSRKESTSEYTPETGSGESKRSDVMEDIEIISRLITVEKEMENLTKRLRYVENEVRTLPETNLLANGFITRAFAVFGHSLFAYVIVAALLFILSVIFSG